MLKGQHTSMLTCCWPGLARLWLRGEWTGLLWAVVFAVGLNFVLVANFIWPELLSTHVLAAAWLAVGIGWCVSVWRTYRQWPELTGSVVDHAEADDLFRQAQSQYLRGHWLEAETILVRLIRINPRDIEARLMLATLYRHSRQPQDAQQQLDILQRTEGAEPWAFEIAQERQLLTTTVTEAA